MENTTVIPTEELKPPPEAWLFFFVPALIICCCFLCLFCIPEYKRTKRAERAGEARRRAAPEIIDL